MTCWIPEGRRGCMIISHLRWPNQALVIDWARAVLGLLDETLYSDRLLAFVKCQAMDMVRPR